MPPAFPFGSGGATSPTCTTVSPLPCEPPMSCFGSALAICPGALPASSTVAIAQKTANAARARAARARVSSRRGWKGATGMSSAASGVSLRSLWYATRTFVQRQHQHVNRHRFGRVFARKVAARLEIEAAVRLSRLIVPDGIPGRRVALDALRVRARRCDAPAEEAEDLPVVERRRQLEAGRARLSSWLSPGFVASTGCFSSPSGQLKVSIVPSFSARISEFG